MISALSDRLYADALSTGLVTPSAFIEAKIDLSLDEVNTRLYERAAVYVNDLSATSSQAEHGARGARDRWLTEVLRMSRLENLGGDIRYRALWLLSNAAVSLLDTQGPVTVLNVDHEEPIREILRWRFISLALPKVIFEAAAAARRDHVPTALRIRHKGMAPAGPAAHQHLHHAAMLSFEELWAALRLRGLLRFQSFTDSIQSGNAFCPGLHHGPCLRSRSVDGRRWAKTHPVESARHMRQWAGLLFEAFVARELLDSHSMHSSSLASCRYRNCQEAVARLRSFLRGGAPLAPSLYGSYPWPAHQYRLERAYRSAHDPDVFSRSQNTRRRLIQDQVSQELGILGRAFRHANVASATPWDPDFDRLLLQYLRVKTALFQLLVHPTGEHGLEKFLDHFSQVKIYEPLSDRLRPACPNEPGLHVAATEYRVAPDAWRGHIGPGEVDLRGKLLPIEEVPEGQRQGEAAWLIHFKRKPARSEVPIHRFAMREMEEEAHAIAAALAQDPRRLRRLRGIDICGVEEQQPLWVSAPALRLLRRRSAEIAARRPLLELEPLRLTLHAGEDFRWLTSGMRAVAEPFRWRLIERGDRIGHGIAVTLDPKGWWSDDGHAGEAMVSKYIDRLQDIGFLAAYTDELPLKLRRPNEDEFWAGRSKLQDEWLTGEIESVAAWMRLPLDREGYPPPNLIHEAIAFWRAIGGRTGRRLIDSAAPPPEDAPLHQRWLHRYFWNRAVQRRAAEELRLTVDSTTHHERDLLAKARSRLIRELARWQIPIESNPSSNLVVASLDAMASQDFLAQSPHEKRRAGKETLPWTISTDDPITFATSLADEYAYAWAGMVLREKDPFDPAHARALLEEAAATSMRTRFTLPDPDVA